jgi:NAD(P)-dependent dehydrogenase (short-subunit alcohol dehydrogenase family)
MNVNLVAGIELSRLVGNRTICQDGEGSIVFISSVYASVGAPGQIAYCASKGAINSAVRAMAIELAPRKIRVNSISSGFIRTEMTTRNSQLSDSQMRSIIDKHPLGEGEAIDVARATAFLLAPENRWITGVDLKVDGGYIAQYVNMFGIK